MAAPRVFYPFVILSTGCQGEFNLAGVLCKSRNTSELMGYADFLHPGDDVQPVDDDGFTFQLTQDSTFQRGGVLSKVRAQEDVLESLDSGCTSVKDWSYSVTMEVRFEGSQELHGDGMTISLVDGSRLTGASTSAFSDPDLGDAGGCLACNGDEDLGCEQGSTVPGWTAELDTYQNSFPITSSGVDPTAPTMDPSGLHLAIAPDCAIDDPSTYLNLEENGVNWDTLTSSWLPLTVEVTPSTMRVALGDLPELTVDDDFAWPDYLLITAATGSDGATQVARDVTTSMMLAFEPGDQDSDTFFDQESGLDALSE